MEGSRGGRRRHGAGSLEGEVMASLWSVKTQLTPGEVQRSLGRDLAYTTVMTTLVRLHSKGMVNRIKSGRAYAYSPVKRADEHAAQAMNDVLSRECDKAAVLSHFVESLAPQEEALLRQLLQPGQRKPK